MSKLAATFEGNRLAMAADYKTIYKAEGWLDSQILVSALLYEGSIINLW